jgi:hypothetical protein
MDQISKVPILSYEALNSKAEEFLRLHNPDDILPVPIDRIIEADFNIDIIPFPNLQRDFGVDGFTPNSLDSIYVDEYTFDNVPTRYRFTISHEIGHVILHSGFIREMHPASITEWKEKILAIDDGEYGWLEYQAYTFAAQVLIPRQSLEKYFFPALQTLLPSIGQAKMQGFQLETYRDFVIDAIGTILAKTFDVSSGAMSKRIHKEIEKDRLHIP